MSTAGNEGVVVAVTLDGRVLYTFRGVSVAYAEGFAEGRQSVNDVASAYHDGGDVGLDELANYDPDAAARVRAALATAREEAS